MRSGKLIRLFTAILAVISLAAAFVVPASAADRYPMSCNIYYKDESGKHLVQARSFSVDAADGPDQTVGYASPAIAGYELKNPEDAYVTYAMMVKSFPASNYQRDGTATYTVVYCPTYTHTVDYIYGSSMQTAAVSQTFTSKANTYYVLYSPSVTGYLPNKNSVAGVQQSSNTFEQVFYYERTYTVSYNANGGSGAPSSQTKYYFSSLTLATQKPTRSGYTFKGWATSGTATTASYQAGGSFSTNADTTLYAVWEKDAKTYLISFDANGGSGAPVSQTKTHGVDLTLPTTVPVRERYKFLGWSTSATATTVMYYAGGLFTTDDATRLYAVWQEINYDFSVSDLVITPNSVYQYENVSVNFRMDSWDKFNFYSDITVTVYLNGTQIYGTKVNFSVYGVNYVTFGLNVGALEGTQTIEARVNWSDYTNETRTTDNKTTATFEIAKLVEVSVDKVLPGGDYIEGNEVISSFYVKNDSASPILPSDHMTFDFEVYEISGSTEILLLEKTWNDVVIPANGKNLVYFKWTVPEGSDGKLYLCRGTANAGNIGGEQNTENNAVFFTVTAKSASEAVTPNTRYERNAPASYVNGTTPPTTATGSVSWTRWIYENGAFALKTYGLKVSTANPIVSPDASCPTAVKEGDKWKMRSGYGYSLEWSPTITALSGSLMPGSDAYTGIQSIFATLPEYRYLQESGKYETLQSSGGSYRFRQNEDADGNARIHFIPVYVANGNYTVSVTASQIWTPVGMVTATRNANTVLIDGTIYDDYYVGN